MLEQDNFDCPLTIIENDRVFSWKQTNISGKVLELLSRD